VCGLAARSLPAESCNHARPANPLRCPRQHSHARAPRPPPSVPSGHAQGPHPGAGPPRLRACGAGRAHRRAAPLRCHAALLVPGGRRGRWRRACVCGREGWRRRGGADGLARAEPLHMDCQRVSGLSEAQGAEPPCPPVYPSLPPPPLPTRTNRPPRSCTWSWTSSTAATSSSSCTDREPLTSPWPASTQPRSCWPSPTCIPWALCTGGVLRRLVAAAAMEVGWGGCVGGCTGTCAKSAAARHGAPQDVSAATQLSQQVFHPRCAQGPEARERAAR
jgi:hypothetical protein